MITKYSIGKKLLILLLLLSSALFANIGTVMALKGEASVERLSGDVDVKAGMKLLEGDTIVTQAKSRVQVMLKDETVVTIGSKSTFSFEEFSLDGANSKLVMRSSRGFFRSVTGKIGKLAPERFKVRTASATIGIRGTDFWGITGGESEKIICNKGAIFIEYDGKVIEVKAGGYVIYGPKGIKEGKTGSGEDGDSYDAKEDEDEEKEDDEEKGDNDKSDSPKIDDIPEEDDISEVDIPTEDIADIVQIIEEIVDITEPFTIDIGGEDRPVQY